MEIQHSKTSYIFEGLSNEVLPEKLLESIRSFIAVENVYKSAIREIVTKLENLNDEFKYTKDRNPIHQIKSRVKTPKSIIEKLTRKGYEISVESARKNLNDIAGIRVICSYIDDIYLIADLLSTQNDIEVLRTIDYIKNPKPNGYRSLHLIVRVPVFLTKGIEYVKAEVQIRTIAMDFWATLEHQLAYKIGQDYSSEIYAELKSCAEVIANTDLRMQKLFNKIKNEK
ncbi:MAG: GTP pyrophosphokinase family protein [Clostridiaceae bacterium]|nr:GTP pyrophosphokinase family protein [Clostridiaceae bacterium]